MEKALSDLQEDMAHIRTGRANISLLDGVRVDYYGSPVPLNQVAQLHVPEPAMITLQPWEPSMIAAIEKAIRSADLGLNPGNDGKLIRVPVPALTEERRRELAKKLSHVAEEHRVALRNIRRDSNEHLKKLLKEKAISEDEERQALDVGSEADRRPHHEDRHARQGQGKRHPRSEVVQPRHMPHCGAGCQPAAWLLTPPALRFC